VTVRATTPITSWTVTMRYANGQQVGQGWSATYSQSGATVTARPAGWNASLPAGGTTTFGCLASWTGTNNPPDISCG